MSKVCRIARRFGLSFLAALSGLVFGLGGAWAGGQAGLGYLPDGPNVPTITLNESEEGAAGLRPYRYLHPMDGTSSRSGT